METIADLYLGGFFERFPTIEIVFAEMGVRWIPYFVERLQYSIDRYQHIDGNQARRPVLETFNHNMYFTFQFDRLGDDLLETLSPSRVMWGSDFPYAESTYPLSRQVADDLRARVGDSDSELILHRNAQRLFRFPA